MLPYRLLYRLGITPWDRAPGRQILDLVLEDDVAGRRRRLPPPQPYHSQPRAQRRGAGRFLQQISAPGGTLAGSPSIGGRSEETRQTVERPEANSGRACIGYERQNPDGLVGGLVRDGLDCVRRAHLSRCAGE